MVHRTHVLRTKSVFMRVLPRPSPICTVFFISEKLGRASIFRLLWLIKLKTTHASLPTFDVGLRLCAGHGCCAHFFFPNTALHVPYRARSSTLIYLIGASSTHVEQGLPPLPPLEAFFYQDNTLYFDPSRREERKAHEGPVNVRCGDSCPSHATPCPFRFAEQLG